MVEHGAGATAPASRVTGYRAGLFKVFSAVSKVIADTWPPLATSTACLKQELSLPCMLKSPHDGLKASQRVQAGIRTYGSRRRLDQTFFVVSKCPAALCRWAGAPCGRQPHPACARRRLVLGDSDLSIQRAMSRSRRCSVRRRRWDEKFRSSWFDAAEKATPRRRAPRSEAPKQRGAQGVPGLAWIPRGHSGAARELRRSSRRGCGRRDGNPSCCCGCRGRSCRGSRATTCCRCCC